jgi:transposase
MDIRELLRHIRVTPSDRQVQHALGMDRRTVKAYRTWAATQGLLDGPLPPPEALQRLVDQTLRTPPPPQVISSVEPYRALVVELRQAGTEISAIRERLKERGYTGSYASVYRFVRALEPPQPEVTVRVECQPGAEAQVDFGYAGRMLDERTGQWRKSWAFVMTLSFSRHQYVAFVFDQKLATWLACHRHAFEFFGGVPKRLVIDNLKAAIVYAERDEPQVQQAYRECAEHYGFLISPCRVRTPQHKGKVEQGGVHYVKRNFLGGRTPTSVTQANTDVLGWCRTTAGQRVHGTTREQPLERFEMTERAALLPLPTTAYDLAEWKVVTLQRDCYVTFDHAYYSAPHRLVGQQLRVRGGTRQVRLYTLDYQLVATHERAQRPGERLTHPDHLPPDKLVGLTLNRQDAQAAAADIGSATRTVVDRLLNDPAVDRLRTVGRLLNLRQSYGDTRLEAACARALRFDDPSYKTVKTILQTGLEAAEPPPLIETPAPRTFVRSAWELVGHLFGGVA